MSPKTGPKLQKNASRPPHISDKKNTLQTQKMTFFWPTFGGRGNEQVYSVLFFTVFCEGERHDLSKTGGFFKKKAPPPGKPEPY